MTVDQVSLLLLIIAAPAATLFPILYMLTAPWWQTWVGRALVVSKIGLAVLVDASLAFHYLGPAYPHRAEVTLTAFALIVVGTWLYLGALVREQILKR